MICRIYICISLAQLSIKLGFEHWVAQNMERTVDGRHPFCGLRAVVRIFVRVPALAEMFVRPLDDLKARKVAHLERLVVVDVPHIGLGT